jgi:hypothetical protein
MGRSRDTKRAQRPDLSPVYAEAAEDRLLATPEQRADAAQSTGHFKRASIDRRARRTPTAKDFIDEVICHQEDTSRISSPSLLSYSRDTYMSEKYPEGRS